MDAWEGLRYEIDEATGLGSKVVLLLTMMNQMMTTKVTTS